MSTLARDAFLPPPPRGTGRGLALAVLAHIALLVGLTLNVQWRAAQPESNEAELWSAVPQVAAPKPVEPEPPVPPPPTPAARVEPPPPPPKPQPAPEPPPPDPQIAIEKAQRAKKEQAQQEAARQRELQARKDEQAQRDEQQRAQREAQKRLDAQRAKAEQEEKKKEAAERARQEDAKLAKLREANLKRVMSQAGATGDPGSPGTAAQSSGPSPSYAGRIKARIKPNIVFADVVSGNPLATVEVKLAPDGTIIGKRLVKSSGNKAWDDAVLRAIEKTDMLPRDIDGRVPPPFEIDFRPND